MIDWNVQVKFIIELIVAPIYIKPVHSSVSYQQALCQKYDRRGRQLPSRYGPLV